MNPLFLFSLLFFRPNQSKSWDDGELTLCMVHKKNKSSGTYEKLLQQIKAGNFSRGCALPPERQLADSYSVSYMTLRKAVGQLVSEGYLVRRQGHGTFVQTEISEQKVRKTVGLLLPAWSAPENLDFIMYFSEIAERSNWLSKVFYARRWDDHGILDAWESCDAMITLTVQELTRIPPELLAKFQSHLKPFVVAAASAEALGLDCVTETSLAAERTLGEELTRYGHRQMAEANQSFLLENQIITANPQITPISAYLTENCPNLRYDLHTLCVPVPRFHLAHHALHDRIMSLGKNFPFSVVFCPLSFYLGVLSGLTDAGLRVPQDVSIVAYGDRQEADFYRPRPTLLRLSLKDMAEQSLHLVLWRNANPEAPVRRLEVESNFIPGETLGPARKYSLAPGGPPSISKLD